MRRAILFLILLLVVQGALAISVTPARQTVTGTDHTFWFKPIFDEGTVRVGVNGDLAEYVNISTTSLHPNEVLTGSIYVPASVEPGVHTQRIIFTHVPDERAGTVSASTAIAAILEVEVPYPNEFYTANWDLTTTGSLAKIVVTLKNLGLKAGKPDYVLITFSDEKGRLENVQLPPPNVPSGEFAQIDKTYKLTLGDGRYLAKLTIVNGEQRFEDEMPFVLGQPSVYFDAVTYTVDTGAVKPIDISGRTRWNIPISMTASVYLDNASEPVLEEQVELSDTFEHRLYLDTVITGEPQHTLRVRLQGEGVTKEKEITIVKAAKQSFRVPVWVWVTLAILILVAWYFLVWKKESS